MDLPRIVCDPRMARPCGPLQTNGDRCCVGRDSSHSVGADLHRALQPGRQAPERWACTLLSHGVRRNAAVVLVFDNFKRRVDYFDDGSAAILRSMLQISRFIRMRAAGFTSVMRWPLGDSDHPDLQNLGNEQRYPEGLLNFESVTLEGSKQAREVGHSARPESHAA